MKKILFIWMLLFVSLVGWSQPFIQGSIQQGSSANSVNIVYLPDHNSAVGEYVNYLGIAIAIPISSATGVTPTISGVGNFASLSFLQASPFSYTQGTEKIFTWFCANGTPLTMSWSNGVSFVGATITFTGGTGTSKVRLIDFTSLGGGPNGATNFNVGVNVSPFDLTNYTNTFYSIAGGNGSSTGTYPSTDQYVETNLQIPLGVCNPSPNAGTVSGTTPLCINATATYTSNGDAGGTWSSTNTAVATVNASSGLVTAVAAGTTDITYTAAGCTPVSSFKILTVSPNVTAGTVSGTSPLSVGGTATYTSNGSAGGSWSSTNTAVATVNASTGLVSALSAGTTNITYTVNSGCGSPVSAFKTLTVSAVPSIQGSVKQGASSNKVDITYLPNYTNGVGEYVNYLSISIAIPTSAATGVTPTIAGVGNFASLTFLQASPFSYTQGSETIYSWFCANGTPLSMFWTSGVEFTGATVTFNGGSSPSKIRMVDFTSLGGGPNGATNFNVGTNLAPFDVTNYTNIFYSIAGANGSTTGTYPGTDQYVETNSTVTLGTCNPAPNAGTVSGTTPLCINATATYSSNGDVGGSWTSTNTAIATVNATTGLVTAVAAGTTDITYTVAGCTPASSFKTLTVSPNVTAGTVSGTSPLSVGGTATYTSNGTGGGSWSSTNTSVATVNAASGLVSAVSAGTTNITYTVNSGCGSPVSSFKTLTVSAAPSIQGSIHQGSSSNTADITYLPNYTNAVGEYVNYLSISIAIPTSAATGVTPTMAGVGNFASLTFLQASPFSYTQGTETIYSWFCANGTPLSMSWTSGVEFTGATITFTGGAAPSKIRMVDFTSLGGGPNGATNFNVGTNIDPFDVTNYTNMFYAIAGANGSITGTYPSTDQYVETNLSIALGTCNPAPNAGTVTGTTPLCINATATYSSNGDAGGSWSSTNTSVATVNATTGLVTGVAAGTTDITYTVSGCTPASSFKTLTVSPNTSAGTVSGTSPLAIGATAVYTSNGTAGGTWSSTNTSVATVNASSGLVSALSAGTTNITYTVNSGCGSPVSSFQTLNINAAPSIQGSIAQGAASNSVDIYYLPNYTSAPGEYVNYLSISIAIPTAAAAGVTATITGVGNFVSLTFLQAAPFSYTQGSETIYSWFCPNGTPTAMSWTAGTSFIGATISFTGGIAPSTVRMVDFASLAGGPNGATNFNVGTNVAPFDVTNYDNIFYSIVGANGSTTGTYPSTDQYVETNLLINLAGCTSALSLTETHTDVSCHGGNNGSITAVANAGIGTYTYNLKQGATVLQTNTTGIFTGLLPGAYIIEATNGTCTTTISVTITEPAGILPDITIGADFTDNLFAADGDEVDVVYNIIEIGGNTAANDTVRIPKVTGYDVIFNSAATLINVSGTNYTLDNAKWTLIFDAVHNWYLLVRDNTGGNNLINCSEHINVSVKVKRNTTNTGIFNFISVFRKALNETYLNNNQVSIRMTAE